MRLLMADDDEVLGRAICSFMMREGHAVDWATDGNQLLALSDTHAYDCLLLDLGLPDLRGDDCLNNIRRAGNATPVIVITAHAFTDHRVRLLDLGADDYLIKPFDLTELYARVKAIVRRSHTACAGEGATQTHGPLTLRPSTNSVMWHGATIALTRTEMRVLEALISRKNRIVTRQELEAEIHGWNESVASNAIEVHVHFLRRKISPDLIHTMRGVGYRLANLELPTASRDTAPLRRP